MRVFLRESVALDRIKWKQTVNAMLLAQSEDGDAIKAAMKD